jgi:Flp pilus assembly secretin CpaC
MFKRSLAALALCVAAWAAPALAGTEVVLRTDEAKVISVSGEPGTVVVGNPSIADVTVRRDQLFVMGRSYGTTNMIVLDRAGNQLASLDVVVTMGGSKTVQVFKAGARMSFACAPDCEATMQIGDRTEFFDAIGKQISSRSEAAAGASKASAE